MFLFQVILLEVYIELIYCYQTIDEINMHTRTSAKPPTDVSWVLTV